MEMKEPSKKVLIPRRVWVFGAIFLQIAFFIVFIFGLREYLTLAYGFHLLLSLIAVLYVLNSEINPSYKIAWILPIILLPVFGSLLYFILGRININKKISDRMLYHEKRVKEALYEKSDTAPRVVWEGTDMSLDAAVQSKYISDYAGYPPYPDLFSEYLPTGEHKFKRLMEALKKARHFIFIEYFIIETGVMWNQILDILIVKAQEGVDVRLIYDDVGCLFTLPFRYDRQLEALGIQCCIFNPITPVVSLLYNNRDHRKITIIDGCIGFTGGINLADEYINEYEKYGHWKDTAILLKGPAVRNMTVMFLSMWGYLKGIEEDMGRFCLPVPLDCDSGTGIGRGVVQPFADSPLDQERMGETVYLNLIYKAKKAVYITTPYLIIANEMVTALCNAAKGGVDIRIITPHKWDKRLVHLVTQTYYEALIECGVRIYEYTPGFMHAKTFVVDDLYGVVGTINMDYRSLYLHFENAVWMYRTESIQEMKRDFAETLKLCQEISLKDCRPSQWYLRLLRFVLRVFSPFL